MKANKFLRFFSRPRPWFVAVTSLAAAVAIGASIYCMAASVVGPWTYVAYGAAALTLCYGVYAVLVTAPRLKRGIVDFVKRGALGRRLAEDCGFRTLAFAGVAFMINTAYAVFEGVTAIIEASVWYGALAAYYILLGTMRCFVVAGGIRHGTEKVLGKSTTSDDVSKIDDKYRVIAPDAEQNASQDMANVDKVEVPPTEIGATSATKQRAKIRIYRICGIALMALTLALGAAVAYNAVYGGGFRYEGTLIYAAAAYTVYKVGVSVHNCVRAHRDGDPIVRALRNVNLADALVSVLALQIAMFTAFGDGTDVGVYNALTGGTVCLAVVTMGIIMATAKNGGGRRGAK